MESVPKDKYTHRILHLLLETDTKNWVVIHLDLDLDLELCLCFSLFTQQKSSRKLAHFYLCSKF